MTDQNESSGPPSSPWDDMIEQMAYNDLKSLYVGERRIRARAEELFREAREILEDLAVAFCPRRVNELQIADPNGMNKLTMTELGQMVKEGTKERIYRLRAQARRAATPREIRKLQLEREEFEGKFIHEQAKVETLRDQRNDLLDDIDTLMWETVRPLMEDNVKLRRGEAVPDLPVHIPGFSTTYREMGQYSSADWASNASSVSRSSATKRVQSPSSAGTRTRPKEKDSSGWSDIELDEDTEQSHRLRGDQEVVDDRSQSDGQMSMGSISVDSIERTGKPPWRTVKARPAPPTPVVPLDLWPDWAQEWAKAPGNFERDCDLVLVAGDTGLAWRIDIAEQLAAWWNVTPKSGGIRRAFKRCMENGLIELVRPKQETAWRPGYLVGLTSQGKEVFRFLRGEDPTPSQLDELMRRHKTWEHIALNLKIAEALWQVGYNNVEIFPDTIPVGDGRVYYPDLKAERGGQIIYIECERRMKRKRSELLAKKLGLYELAAGKTVYFATPTEEARRYLLHMIQEAVPEQVVRSTSIEYLEQSGYRVADVWK